MASSPYKTTDAAARLAVLDAATERLEAAEREAPRRTAAWLLMEVLGCDRGQLYAHPDRPVAPEARRRFEAMVERCVAGEPLQHVLGYASFRGLRIAVSPAVMVPRPETEEVVEDALATIGNVERPRVLDVGTGSGCIGLSVKHERPDARVQAWDVSADALDVAQDNADRLGLDVHLARVDLFGDNVAEALLEPVDLLVSNPPYIPDQEAETLPPVVRDYDPDVALFSGDDPLRFYRALASRAPNLCAFGGALVVETHADYAHEAASVLENEGLTGVSVQEDLSGRPRILSATYPEP